MILDRTKSFFMSNSVYYSVSDNCVFTYRSDVAAVECDHNVYSSDSVFKKGDLQNTAVSED